MATGGYRMSDAEPAGTAVRSPGTAGNTASTPARPPDDDRVFAIVTTLKRKCRDRDAGRAALCR
jgi:hypothetical protein